MNTFKNIGGKIKTLAKLICILGIIASVLSAIVSWTQSPGGGVGICTALVVLVMGCLGSWVGSFFAYGFGDLIEQTAENRKINAQILDKLNKQG